MQIHYFCRMEMNKPSVIAIIPARYGSTRFAGKPLAMIAGEPMIWHVYRRAALALGEQNVWVATDDNRILEAITTRGGNALISSRPVDCGTDRCADALDQLPRRPDIVVNLQGDEPLIDPADINLLVNAMSDKSVDIATLARRFHPTEGFEALFDPGTPKVTFDSRHNALYFSRSIIPYVRDHDWKQWTTSADFHIHVGTYAFRTDVLSAIASLPPSPLEQAEKLEQLRWLEAGYRIRVALTANHSISVDTPDDIKRIQVK